MTPREGRNFASRRPTETSSILLGAIGAIITYALNLDQEIAWTVPVLVGAAPAGITWFVDLIASRFGNGGQSE